MKFFIVACVTVFITCFNAQATTNSAELFKAKDAAVREADQEGDYDTVRSLLENMINDSSLSPSDRVKSLLNYHGRARKNQGGNVAKADEFAEALLNIEALDNAAYTQLILLRIDIAGNNNRADVREELLKNAVASEKIPLARRCRLAYELALAHLLRTDDIPGAIEIVERMTEPKDMQEEEISAAYQALGDLQKMIGNQKHCIAAYEKIYRLTKSPRQHQAAAKMIYDAYMAFGEPKKAREHLMQHGDPIEKARMDRNFAVKLINDEKTDAWTKSKVFAMFCNNTTEDAEIRAKFANLFKKNDFLLPILRGKYGSGNGAGNDNSLGIGSYEYALEILGYAEESSSAKTLEYAKYKIKALAGLNRYSEVKNYIREFLAISNANHSVETRYLLDLVDAVIELPDKPGVAKAAVDKIDDSSKEYKELIRPPQTAAQSKTTSSRSTKAKVPNKKATALIELASIVSHSRKNDLARDIYALYEAMFIPQPRKQGEVTFVEKPLLGIGDFLAIKNNLKSYQLDRVYGGDLEYLSATDITEAGASRSAGSDGKGTQTLTTFYPLCDENGFHVFFDNPDPDPKTLAAGIGTRGYSYEVYFAPGWNQPYVSPGRGYGASSSSWQYQTTYNNITYRRFEENTPEFKHECLYYDKGFYAHYFFAWDHLYNKLPDSPSEFYEFDTINWSPEGGFAWSTRLNVHSRLEWGRLSFALTKEQLRKIKRQIIFHARQEYLASKKLPNGPVDFWMDDVIGDPEFYHSKIKPLVEQLDAFLPKVSVSMSDADVDQVFQEAVPGWKELAYIVSAMRAKYLREQMLE